VLPDDVAYVTPVRFDVDGLPVPQGSMRALVVKGRAIVTHAKGHELAVWRQAISVRAHAAGVAMLEGPVALGLRFRLLRPASRPKRDTRPDRRPDLDKLVRAVFDGLTGIAFADDAQIVYCVAEKVYAPTPGLGVTIAQVA
jgi:crossover junction endodeoxyribonuclease RusA